MFRFLLVVIFCSVSLFAQNTPPGNGSSQPNSPKNNVFPAGPSVPNSGGNGGAVGPEQPNHYPTATELHLCAMGNALVEDCVKQVQLPAIKSPLTSQELSSCSRASQTVRQCLDKYHKGIRSYFGYERLTGTGMGRDTTPINPPTKQPVTK